MRSSTDPVKILIVEDDKFKLDSIRSHLINILGNKLDIEECQALSSAASSLCEQRFDVVIIDMSIHSHEPQKGAGSPVPLPSGGLDVLFEVEFLGHKSICIILTQYMDIQIEGVPVPVAEAVNEIREKFGIVVAACFQYNESGSEWKDGIKRVVSEL